MAVSETFPFSALTGSDCLTCYGTPWCCSCFLGCWWEPSRPALRGCTHLGTWEQSASVSKICAGLLLLGQILQRAMLAGGQGAMMACGTRLGPAYDAGRAHMAEVWRFGWALHRSCTLLNFFKHY